MQSLTAVALFVIGTLVVGLVLYTPFYIWFAARRRQGKRLAEGELGQELRSEQASWLWLLVVLLVGLAAWGELKPESWIGQLMQLPGGNWATRWVALAILLLIYFVWHKVIRKKAESESRSGKNTK